MTKKAVLVLLLVVILAVGCTTGSGLKSENVGVITNAPTPPASTLVEEGVTPEPSETPPAVVITPIPVPASEPESQ